MRPRPEVEERAQRASPDRSRPLPSRAVRLGALGLLGVLAGVAGRRLLGSVAPRPEEVAAARPGDDLVSDPDLVMDTGFDLPAPPEQVWPWLLQLGKERAGWYMPAAVERFIPPGRRALRHLDPALARLEVGQTIPDWGGPDAAFTVDRLDPAAHLVHRSVRGRMAVSWALVLTPGGHGTRMHLRLRAAPVRHPQVMGVAGGAVDRLTIALLAAGLRERLVGRPG